MKFLTGVTITGADDAVDMLRLLALSEKFPFVEWGVLVSAKRQGTARYPSANWRSGLQAHDGRKALHVCGGWAKWTMDGRETALVAARALGCARVQVNGWVPSPGLVGLAVEFFDLEIVLQARDENGLAEAARHAAAIRNGGGRASVLWDPSGGTGVRGRLDVVADGYAGGISPDNVGEVLEELAASGRRCWIDMESGVRTGDAFDLRKVRAVLEAAAPFVVEG